MSIDCYFNLFFIIILKAKWPDFVRGRIIFQGGFASWPGLATALHTKHASYHWVSTHPDQKIFKLILLAMAGELNLRSKSNLRPLRDGSDMNSFFCFVITHQFITVCLIHHNYHSQTTITSYRKCGMVKRKLIVKMLIL